MLGTTFHPSSWLFGLLIQPLLIAGLMNHGVIEEHNLPAGLAADESAIATWSLETGSSGGFARFQIQFPAGIIAESIENAGASFTFENGRSKFIWIETAPEQTINLKMRLTATEDFHGGVITQWFSYISDGTRKDVEFEPHPISVTIQTDIKASESKENAKLTITRSWLSEGPDVGRVTLSVSGHEAGQFLRIEETFGLQCSAEPLEDFGASLRDVFDQSILFVWQQAPSTAFEVQYRVMGNTEVCWASIVGQASTVMDGAVQEMQIAALKLSSQDPVLDDVADHEAQPSTTAKPTKIADPKRKSPLNPIRFKVQVLASHQLVNAAFFVKKYQFTRPVIIEEHDEWIKYITGSFNEYKSARDARVEIRESHDLPGPFVTAYSGNRRITVQEALLTTKQNWIP
jgi:hypothetical protein